MDDLIKARIDLLRENPFYGRLALMLELRELEGESTASTDGEYFYFNADYIKSLTPDEQKSLVLHELLHVALGHIWRKDDREMHIWNVACDYAVNIIVMRSGMTLNKHWLYDIRYANMFAEEIYDELKQNMKSLPKCGGGGGGKSGNNGNNQSCPCGGSHRFWERTRNSKKAKRLRAKWENAIQQAVKRSQGNVPAEFERFIEQMDAGENWREILMNYMSVSRTDFDLLRRDRRSLQSPFYFPDLQDENQLKNIVCVIDSSGSIANGELNQFIAEIKDILKTFPNTTGWFINCDAAIQQSCPLDEVDSIKTFYGGGGTSHIPVFREIEERQLNPRVVICFTDLYTDFPKTAPNYPVLWLVPESIFGGGEKPPFGRVIKMIK